MKSQVMAALLATLALGAGDAAAQSIGIFADSSATSCNIEASQFHTWYVVAVNSDAIGGFRGVDFSVDLDGASYGFGPFASTSAAHTDGDLLGGLGATFAWDTCQKRDTVIAAIAGILADTRDRTYRVEAGYQPGPLLQCPYLIQCDDPVFTKVCVAGGRAFVNSQRNCSVGVDDRTWSQVKSLFGE